MKKIAIVLVLFIKFSEAKNSDVLNQMVQKLTTIKNISYKYTREINAPSKRIFEKMSGKTYLDFTSGDNILGFKFQYNSDSVLLVFNGSECFELDKANRTMIVYDKITASKIRNYSFLSHSLVTIKNSLNAIINDNSIPKTLSDTTINGKYFFKLKFVLTNKTLNPLVGYNNVLSNRKIIYTLIIDKNNLLPTEVRQSNDVNKDILKTTFSYYEINPEKPKENTWYYSNYSHQYQLRKLKNTPMILTGNKAIDWTLPAFNQKSSIVSSQFIGKLVLMEFWISNCGYCITAVPKLNELYSKYKDKGLVILGINPYESNERVKQFLTTTPTQFKILLNGKTLAERYGVFGYPSLVLIDKKGIIIYSGSFEYEKIEELINKNI